MSRGDNARAATLLRQVLVTQPRNMLALRRLAQCLAMLGDYAGCRPLGEAMLAADPMAPWGHLTLGTGWAMAGDMAAAEPYLASARELGADMPQVLIRLGGLALMRGQAGQAVALFEDALRLDSDRPDALFGLGVAQQQIGDAGCGGTGVAAHDLDSAPPAAGAYAAGGVAGRAVPVARGGRNAADRGRAIAGAAGGCAPAGSCPRQAGGRRWPKRPWTPTRADRRSG